ncbi:hypothetical protein BB558_005838 [Smittium angustum]|uniref:Ras-GAP domain-containing protein n=1 Tax=Smittium angustum TaxID=133377 RepID=A0A2U1IZC4_SMIAN|nr:hypothetical protein BB558_005956 [Smittium angustum]PVZ98180.1 hypothetical protein BB558_005838 [Smittium angustum]
MNQLWSSTLNYIWGDPNSAEYHIGEQNSQLYGRMLYLARKNPIYLAAASKSRLSIDYPTKVIPAILELFPQEASADLLKLIIMVIKVEFDELVDASMFLRDTSISSGLIRAYCSGPEFTEYLKKILEPTLNTLKKIDTLLQPSYNEKTSGRNSQLWSLIDDTKSIGDTKINGSQSILTGNKNNGNERSLITENHYLYPDKLVGELLNRILSNMNSFPPGLRLISTTIRGCANKLLKKRRKVFVEKYNEPKIHSLLGGFFFLRFINPALMIPESIFNTTSDGNIEGSTMGEAKGHVEPRNPIIYRKNLTLLAKKIQTLANQSLPPKSPYFQSSPHTSVHTSFTESLNSRFRRNSEMSTINNQNIDENENNSTIYNEKMFLESQIRNENYEKVIKILDLISKPAKQGENIDVTEIENPDICDFNLDLIQSSRFHEHYERQRSSPVKNRSKKSNLQINISTKNDVLDSTHIVDDKNKDDVLQYNEIKKLFRFSDKSMIFDIDKKLVCQIKLKSIYTIHEIILETVQYWEVYKDKGKNKNKKNSVLPLRKSMSESSTLNTFTIDTGHNISINNTKSEPLTTQPQLDGNLQDFSMERCLSKLGLPPDENEVNISLPPTSPYRQSLESALVTHQPSSSNMSSEINSGDSSLGTTGRSFTTYKNGEASFQIRLLEYDPVTFLDF